MFSAVLSLLTSVQYRIALVEEFESYCKASREVLSFEQFDMVIRLINQVLQVINTCLSDLNSKKYRNDILLLC